MQLASRFFFVAAVLIGAGCSPTFDWREVRFVSGLVALFPCRPETHSRQLLLAGDPVTMELASCTAGELTFAVGQLELADAARVEPVKQILRDALRLNLALPARTATGAEDTMQAQSDRFSVDGSGPDGKPLSARSRIFSRTATVFQATVYGRQLKAEPVDFFFSSLK